MPKRIVSSDGFYEIPGMTWTGFDAGDVPKELSRGAVRFSFGRETSDEHVDQVVGILKRELSNAR